MEKDLEKELEEILEKHKSKESKEEFHGFGFFPCEEPFCGDWVLSLFMLGLLNNGPALVDNKGKQPVINIYLGGDK